MTSISPIKVRLSALLVLLVAAPLSAAEFVVTHGGDSGEGSLRQAILDANANPGEDRIDNETGVAEILPTSPLPHVTDPIFADLRAIVDGSGIPGEADGLVIEAKSMVSVQVRNFGGTGVVLLRHSGSVLYAYVSHSRRGIEVRGGGRHAILSSASDNEAEGLLVTHSHGNLIGSMDTCELGPCIGFFGQLISHRNGIGVRLTGDFNDLGVSISDNSGDGVVLNGAGNILEGDSWMNGGAGVRAFGSNLIFASSEDNGEADYDLDDTPAVIHIGSAISRKDPEARYIRGGVFLTGELAALPNRRYHLGAESFGGTTVITDGAGRAPFIISGVATHQNPPLNVTVKVTGEGADLELGALRDTVAMPLPVPLAPDQGGMSDLALLMSGPAQVSQGETFIVAFEVSNLGSAPEPEATLYMEPHVAEAWYVNGYRTERSSSNGVVFPIAAGETVRIEGVMKMEAGDELRATILEADSDGSNNFAVLPLIVIPDSTLVDSVRLEIDAPEPAGPGLARRRFRLVNDGHAGAGLAVWPLIEGAFGVAIASQYGNCTDAYLVYEPVSQCRVHYIGAGETIEGVLYLLDTETPGRRRLTRR